MNRIKLKNQEYEFKIIRSNRKTIGIIVNADQELTVRSPKKTSIRQIKSLLSKKEDWIIKKLSKLSEIKAPPSAKEFISGDNFLYLGKEYRLKLITEPNLKQFKVELEKNKLLVHLPFKLKDKKERKDAVRDRLISWYRSQAKLKINELINIHKRSLEVEPNKIVIKKQKKRWGSCSSKKNLNFNWKIIMAPPAVIEYLVVHELVHLIHPNHAKVFWQTVAELIPNYEEQKEWLRINGRRLII
ncbi:MAG: M48 family metallopeptidase [Bacillota bacterium]